MTIGTATPTADAFVKADGTAKIADGWLPATGLVAGTAVGGDLAGTLPNPTVTAARFATPGPVGSVTPSTVAADGLALKEGANMAAGVAAMVLGTVVVATTRVTANSRIQLTAQSLGTVTAPKALAVSARTPGTSFTILSSDLTDTSPVAWVIIEPA
jgi:hypothetical protein